MPPQLTADVFVSLFPLLDPGIVREVAAAADGDDAIALRHLLLLSKGHFLRAIADEVERRPMLLLLRGLPGAGKSTLARALQICCSSDDDNSSAAVVVSADDFFIDADGDYIFVPSLLDKAHQFCQSKARTAMKCRKRAVVVDNTNLQAWEMQPYCKLAAEAKYCVLVVEPTTSWKRDPARLAKKTTHQVPLEKIRQMRGRMEEGVGAEGVCTNLPAPFRPQCTTMEKLLKMLELAEAEPSPRIEQRQEDIVDNNNCVDKPIANGVCGTSKGNEDFQSLLQCFPDLSPEDIYFPYLKTAGNMEHTMNCILDEKQHSVSRDDSLQFEMVLDADLALQLERNFGTVRGAGPSFPGALTFQIPKTLARMLHWHWQKSMSEKLTAETVSRLLIEDKLRPVESCSSRSSSPNISTVTPESIESDGSSLVDEPARPVSRQEVQLLRSRRAEVYQKAAAAYKAKQGGVASYYSEEGRALTKKIEDQEANLRYQTFVESNSGKNSTSLDLHGLTVPEALENLEWFIEEKYQRLMASAQDRVRLEIITGRGSKGKAKIKPAVIAFLKKTELSFSEANPGSFDVLLKRGQM